MKIAIAALAALGALSLSGCSSDDPRPTSSAEGTTAPATAAATTPLAPEAEPVGAVVDQFYGALGMRDCFTMRVLAALSYQQDDDYWADGCIDELQEQVGDTYAYTILDGSLDGQESVFHVQRTLPDESTAVDTVVLIDVSGGWAVESRTVGDG